MSRLYLHPIIYRRSLFRFKGFSPTHLSPTSVGIYFLTLPYGIVVELQNVNHIILNIYYNYVIKIKYKRMDYYYEY